MAAAGRELEQQLKEIGSKLLPPPSSVDETLSLLDHAECFLSRVEQSPAKSMQDALSSLTQALATVELLRHSNVDVKVAVASCISEITRITAPDAPYDDDKMKDVFQLIVSSFENLPDKCSRSYTKRAMILETVAKVRSCVVMLDLECDGLIAEMIQLFLSKIREYHSENIFLSMETIMTLVLEESEEISPEILAPLLASVKKNNKEVLPIAVKLAEKVLQNCAVKLKPYLSQVIKSLDAAIDDYGNIIASICRGDSSVNHNDENTSNEPAVVEDNSAVTSTDEAQETRVAEDTKNKEDDATPEVKLTNGVDGSGYQKDATSTKVESSVNANEQILDDQTSADKVALKLEVDDLESKKSPRLESKLESAAKKKGKKSNISKTKSESSDAAHVADEKEVGGCPDQEKGNNVEALNGLAEEDKAVQASSPMDDSVENLPSPKASDAEAIRTTSPSSTGGTLADEIRRKRTGRPKKKQKLVKEDSNLKNATEGTKESEAKTKKLKRPSADSVIEGKINADVAISKSGSAGGTSDSGLKARTEVDNKAEECSNVNDATSSQRTKGGRNRGRDKVASEDEKTKSDTKDDAKMIHTPKSPRKSAKDEGVHDEIIVTSTKRNRSSVKDKKKGSEITEYGGNIVGAKVKVFWPKDLMYYEGVIEFYDPIKNKHTIKYDDGDIEVLNLKKEQWKFIEDPVSSEVQGSEPADQDFASEMPKKKKFKTPLSETAAKLGKTHESSSSKGGGSVSSSKSKAVGGVVPKSGGKSKESKSKDEGNEPSKLKEKSSKAAAAKSDDDTSTMKSKENDGAASSKSKSKQQESQKVSAEKPKEDTHTPKTIGGSSKSKGKAATPQASSGVEPSPNIASGKSKSKETGGGDTKEKKKVKSTPAESRPHEESDAAAAAAVAVSSKKRRR